MLLLEVPYGQPSGSSVVGLALTAPTTGAVVSGGGPEEVRVDGVGVGLVVCVGTVVGDAVGVRPGVVVVPGPEPGGRAGPVVAAGVAGLVGVGEAGVVTGAAVVAGGI